MFGEGLKSYVARAPFVALSGWPVGLTYSTLKHRFVR